MESSDLLVLQCPSAEIGVYKKYGRVEKQIVGL